MKARHLLIYLAILLGVGGSFTGLHHLLQQDDVYQPLSEWGFLNYQREGTWNNPVIYRDSVPYRSISNDNLSNWDGAIYNCLRQHYYADEQNCYDDFKASFLPGFPTFWRITGLDFRGISVLNYLLYALSLILMLQILRIDAPARFWAFAMLLGLGNAVVFAMPYSEALFSLAGTLTIIAYLKKHKIGFFLAFFLLMITRVAGLFFLVGIMLYGLYHLIYRKRFGRLNWPWVILALASSILAYVIYFGLLYYQRGGFMAYFEATDIQYGFWQLFWPLRDWSHEGFGMNLFTLLAVMLPSFLYSIYLLVRPRILLTQGREGQVAHLAHFYIAGIFLFTLLHSGGVIHSLHRFVILSPAFLYLAYYYLARRDQRPLFILAGLTTLAGLLLPHIEYSGHEWSWDLIGLILLPLQLILISLVLKSRLRIWPILGLIALLLNIFWASYLHNQYLSNAWIFT